jgi:hypothetical protein
MWRRGDVEEGEAVPREGREVLAFVVVLVPVWSGIGLGRSGLRWRLDRGRVAVGTLPPPRGIAEQL